MKKILGLDLGTNSIGWAVIKKKNVRMKPHIYNLQELVLQEVELSQCLQTP